MKISPPLAASLALNLVFLAAALYWSPPLSKAHATTGKKFDGTVSLSSGGVAARLAPPSPSASASATSWDRLRTADLADQAARLRAAGFPPHVVNALLRSLVNERFGELWRLQSARENPAHYWESRPDFNSTDPKTREEISRLQRERADLLKQLLGPQADDDEQAAIYRHRRYGSDLAPEKAARLDAIARDYSELQLQITAATKGTMLPADREKILLLLREQRADVEKTLTPAELLEYDLRNSAPSAMLRNETAALDLSEAEFRALFPLYVKLNAHAAMAAGPRTAEELVDLGTAQAAMHEEIKALLGAERYADFQLSRNYDYQQTAKVVARLQLPATTTRDVYAVQKDIQQRVLLTRSQNPSPAERESQLNALSAEASQKIGGLLGTKGLEAYLQYGGQWLQNVAPRPATPKK